MKKKYAELNGLLSNAAVNFENTKTVCCYLRPGCCGCTLQLCTMHTHTNNNAEFPFVLFFVRFYLLYGRMLKKKIKKKLCIPKECETCSMRMAKFCISVQCTVHTREEENVSACRVRLHNIYDDLSVCFLQISILFFSPIRCAICMLWTHFGAISLEINKMKKELGSLFMWCCEEWREQTRLEFDIGIDNVSWYIME